MSVNKFRGEYKLENGMTAVVDFNALAIVQNLAGRNAFEVLSEIEGGKLDPVAMCWLAYAFLKRHQPDITEEEAGDVLSNDVDFIFKTLLAAQPETGTDDSGNVQRATKAKPKPKA